MRQREPQSTARRRVNRGVTSTASGVAAIRAAMAGKSKTRRPSKHGKAPVIPPRRLRR